MWEPTGTKITHRFKESTQGDSPQLCDVFKAVNRSMQQASSRRLSSNCLRLGLNPYEYLRYVLTRLPRLTNQQTHTVTPAAWAREKAAASKPALKLAS